MHKYISSSTFAFAYDMFGIFCEICRNQSMAPRFYYSDSCTCFERCVSMVSSKVGTQVRLGVREIEEDTDTDRQTDRQTNRQTD